MTSERRGFLPAGHSYGSSLPRHMTQPELNSSTTDSIGSNDSFQSQVPQPFYMMNEESHAAKTSYAVAINTRGGNDEGTDSKALVLGADSKSLNPKTKSYVPTGSTPTMSPGFSGQLPIGMGHGDSGLSQGRAAMQGYPQQSWGYGHGHHGKYLSKYASKTTKIMQPFHIRVLPHFRLSMVRLSKQHIPQVCQIHMLTSTL